MGKGGGLTTAARCSTDLVRKSESAVRAVLGITTRAGSLRRAGQGKTATGTAVNRRPDTGLSALYARIDKRVTLIHGRSPPRARAVDDFLPPQLLLGQAAGLRRH